MSNHGNDRFGPAAESFARFFGTVEYLLIQTVVVALWIVLNTVGLVDHWDPSPFILLNLIFSTQAAYAAPLILLAQNRQADRDKVVEDREEAHREELASRQLTQTSELAELVRSNTALTQEVRDLTAQMHVWVCKDGP